MENKLLVLQVLLKYYIETQSLYIRRADLLQLVDDEVAKTTENAQTEMGRETFARIISYLEFNGALIAKKDKAHKLTEFQLIIPKIKNLISQNNFYSIFPGIRHQLEEDEIEVPILQDVIKETVRTNLDQNKWNNFLYPEEICDSNIIAIAKNAVVDIMTAMAPKLYSFYGSSLKGNAFEITDKIALKHMIEATRLISLSDTTKSFKIVLEYSGLVYSRMWRARIARSTLSTYGIFLQGNIWICF